MRAAFPVAMVIALTTLGTARARAQAAPEGESDPTARTHDGFYLRLSLGGGAIKAKFSGGDKAPDAEGSGGGPMLDVLIGGTPAAGLVVGGGYQFDMAQQADYQFGSNSTGSDGNVVRGVIGPFVEWFPDRHGGFSTGLLAGYTMLALQTPTIRILGTQIGGDINTLGIGGNIWVGYAQWLSSQWALGLEARAGFASTKNQDDSSQTGSATSWAVLITGVHH